MVPLIILSSSSKEARKAIFKDMDGMDTRLAVMLAAEGGMLDILKGFEAENGALMKIMPKLPLLYGAVAQSYTGSFTREAHENAHECLRFTLEMMICLLSIDYDPKEYVYLSSKSMTPTTPRMVFLQLIGSLSMVRYNISLVLEAFAAAGADLTAADAVRNGYVLSSTPCCLAQEYTPTRQKVPSEHSLRIHTHRQTATSQNVKVGKEQRKMLRSFSPNAPYG